MRELKKDNFLKTADVSAYLGVSIRTVTDWATQWIESGGKSGLPGFKIGPRQWRFKPEDIEEWVRSKAAPAFVALKSDSGKLGRFG